jgi:hypothetical protein
LPAKLLSVFKTDSRLQTLTAAFIGALLLTVGCRRSAVESLHDNQPAE